MENKFYTDDFERLLKERSDEFRMYPSKRVWHSIYNDLHPGRKWPSIAMSLLIIIAVLFMGYLNNDAASSAQLAANINDANNGGDKKNNDIFGISLSDDELSGSTSTSIAQAKVIPINDGFTSASSSANSTNSLTNTGTQATNNNNRVSPTSRHSNSTTPLLAVAASENNNQGIVEINNANDNVNDQNNSTGNRNSHHRNKTTINQRNNNSIVVTNATAEENNSFVTTGIAPEKKISHKVSTVTTSASDIALNENDELQVEVANNDLKKSTASSNLTPDAKAEDKSLADNQGNLSDKLKTQETEKAWLENYAFYNKSSRKRWKDKMAFQLYTTPSIGYRSLGGNAKYDPAASLTAPTTGDVSKDVNHAPGLGLEAGVGLVYSANKKLRIKGGLQLNFTNYNIHADKTDHPIVTTLMLNDESSGYPYIAPRTSTLANSSSISPAIVHSKTYQVSLPLGVAFKLYGNNKMEWYAGASIQPSFVFGGDAFLISSDRKNYVEDPSFIRKMNVNTGVETFVSYNLGTFSLQAGPQFRYQLFSTYNKQYTNTEKLYNVGLKIGILKNF